MRQAALPVPSFEVAHAPMNIPMLVILFGRLPAGKSNGQARAIHEDKRRCVQHSGESKGTAAHTCKTVLQSIDAPRLVFFHPVERMEGRALIASYRFDWLKTGVNIYVLKRVDTKGSL